MTEPLDGSEWLRPKGDQMDGAAVPMTPAEFKTLRSSLGLSAAKLAEALGVCERSIWYWEAGRAVPEPVARLARLLERAPRHKPA